MRSGIRLGRRTDHTPFDAVDVGPSSQQLNRRGEVSDRRRPRLFLQAHLVSRERWNDQRSRSVDEALSGVGHHQIQNGHVVRPERYAYRSTNTTSHGGHHLIPSSVVKADTTNITDHGTHTGPTSQCLL